MLSVSYGLTFLVGIAGCNAPFAKNAKPDQSNDAREEARHLASLGIDREMAAYFNNI
jgi:hypothetical protein